jgi:hypothetical protein
VPGTNVLGQGTDFGEEFMPKAILLLSVVLAMVLCGCRASPTVDPDSIETWELLPFYGETRFLIVDEDTGAPVPGATLQVEHLHIEEWRDEEALRSGPDGRIVIHQIHWRYSYRGEGPPLPTFTFSAPGYGARTYSVEELVAGTDYDPYRGNDFPTITFVYDEDEDGIELPVYELTVRLEPDD